MNMYKFSGHESFPCRYTWLPKAFLALKSDPNAFADEEKAMVTLGVGKNMVRAIRFWAQAADIAEPAKRGGYSLTNFGRALFDSEGFDPYMEDIRTLWLIHWKLSSNTKEPLFAWDFLLNRWQHPEISHAEVLSAFMKEGKLLERKLSPVTMDQHFYVFLHTYLPTRGRKGEIQEDNLDCPLVELDLIQKTGERKIDKTGKRETIYTFRREEKPEITPELFNYCLNDFWDKRHPNEKTLSFRAVSVGHGSPGQIFKIPEWDMRERLEAIEKDSRRAFAYKESASLQQITRSETIGRDFLSEIYDSELVYV